MREQLSTSSTFGMLCSCDTCCHLIFFCGRLIGLFDMLNNGAVILLAALVHGLHFSCQDWLIGQEKYGVKKVIAGGNHMRVYFFMYIYMQCCVYCSDVCCKLL